MHARCIDAGRPEFIERLAVEEHVHDVGAVPRVSSRDHDSRRTQVLNPSGRVADLRQRFDATAADELGLGKIRRHQTHTGQQHRYEREHTVRIEQRLTARGQRDRVGDDERQVELLDGRDDRFDDGGRRQHAGLGGMDGDVPGNRFDLRDDEVGRQRRRRREADRALGRDRRDRAQSVHPERRERLEVGLNAGPAARVAAGDCQGGAHALRFSRMHPTLLAVMSHADTRPLHIAERAGAVGFVAALTAAAAQISVPLPFTPVPFTFQPMVVLVGAAALGARLGAASQLLYLALGVAGLPVFAMSPVLAQGAARLLGPTGGYLMSYPLAAFVAGALAERGFDRRYLTAVLAMVCGLAVVFAGGILWLTIAGQPSYGLSRALAAGFFPFIIPDLLKLLVAASVMPGLWRIRGTNAR